jgi:3-vinyl bacteriochlorophyllide hydratase
MNASDNASGNHRSEAPGSFGPSAYPTRADGRRFGRGAARPTVLDDLIDFVAPCPWEAHSGRRAITTRRGGGEARPPLYSPEERRRRDVSPWTLVQGVLAPLQFLAFAVSIALIARYLTTGRGYEIATASILVKTAALYAIMITGSIWEKEVFGKWLFAPAFFWEDMFSMLVLALQTAYLAAFLAGWGTPRDQMLIAVAAYGVYVVNASQFLLKLRAARLENRSPSILAGGPVGRAA